MIKVFCYFQRKLMILLMSLASMSFAQASYAENNFIFLELFSSTGCSSCPPAEQWLSKIAATSSSVEIIALNYHVTYWNYLGWTDPFSDKKYDTRQRFYVRQRPTVTVYTPQIRANGREVTSFAEATRQTQRHLAEFKVSATKHENKIDVMYEVPPKLPESHELYLVITEDNLLDQPKAGELNGSTLQLSHVVRTFNRVNLDKDVSQTSISIPSTWNTNHLRVIGFIQNTQNGQLIDARETQLE